MSLYYQPSNKLPLGGVLLLVLGSVVAAAALAFVYIYAMWYIPFIYVNFFLCLGFGLALGWVLAALVRAGKLRSPGGVTALAGLVGLAAVYVEWAVYLTLLFNSETTGTGRDADTTTSFSAGFLVSALTHPGQMLAAMRQINETGTWSLKGSTPSGIFLALIWLLEALIIVGGAVLLARAQAGEPFSETADEWAAEEEMAHPVGYVHDAAAVRTALETGQFHTLTPYRSEAAEDQFARLKLHHAPNDANCRYLTLENVTTTLDKKGKPTQSTSAVVQRLAISPAAYQDLKTRFGTLPGGVAPA